jgi:hypothetical protein
MTWDIKRERKVKQQRRRRKKKPGVNPETKALLDGRDYLETYNELLKGQEGVCGICGRPPKQRRLHMDHDHDTGEIRGLLCYPCNTGLGFIDNYLEEVMRYLS